MKRTIRNSLIICLIVTITLTVCGCSLDSDDIANQVQSIAQADNEYVLGVKYGTPPSYPDITYVEAFEAFFAYPTWTYFQGKREGDEKVYDTVEFTGNCMFADKEVKALIQFTISDDKTTFEATYFSLNDIPQSMIDLNGLIDKVFSEYKSANGM